MSIDRFTIEEASWGGAEIFAWDGLEGELIGEASFASLIGERPARATIHLHALSPIRQPAKTFASPAEILAWLEANYPKEGAR